MTSRGQGLFFGIVCFLFSCFLALLALIMTPLWLPQIYPGTELWLASALFVLSLGIGGFAYLVWHVSALRRDMHDMSRYVLSVQRDVEARRTGQSGHYEASQQPLTPEPGFSHLAGGSTEGIAKGIAKGSAEGSAEGSKDNQMPYLGDMDSRSTSAVASAFRGEPHNTLESGDSDAGVDRYTEGLPFDGPRLEWILQGVFRLPQRQRTHTLLDLWSVNERNNHVLLSHPQGRESELLQESVLFAIERLAMAFDQTSGDLYLPLPEILCQEERFISRLVSGLSLLGEQKAIRNRLKFALPQSVLEAEQVPNQLAPLMRCCQVDQLGLRLAAYGDGTMPENPMRYGERFVTHFITDSRNREFNLVSRQGMKNFSILADRLHAHTVEIIVTHVDSPETLARYRQLPITLVSGRELGGREVRSLLSHV